MSVINVPDASVIVVSFNTRELLRESLLTVRDSSGVTFETIVVDNASHDGSADMVTAEFPEVRLIRSNINLGFAAANNRAFEIALGRYVVLLNSDAFLRPGALRLSVEHMDANPLAGLAGARLVGRDGSWQPSARMFPSLLNNLLAMSGLAARYPKSRLLGRMDRTWANPLEPCEVDWVPGAYSIIRRSVLDRIGFFDERFFLYYEEVDLCRRVKATNSQVWYWPDIVVEHLGGESAKCIDDTKVPKPGSRTELWRMRAGLLYFRKHHGSLGAWSNMLIERCWYCLRAIRNSWSNSAERSARVADLKSGLATLKQAWGDTRGGKVSPSRPW
ncbi:glycosyltransferase family 2 protein [Candidatus Binatus sp.]|uniref:glycosyltransferase family 2 protein n=1 Tax=Candidatus Binatus sp. TaxID=2811406 RepID=UPI003C96DDBE